MSVFLFVFKPLSTHKISEYFFLGLGLRLGLGLGLGFESKVVPKKIINAWGRLAVVCQTCILHVPLKEVMTSCTLLPLEPPYLGLLRVMTLTAPLTCTH